ncbi:MAG: 50S ribosomal protein L10 [Verrucomicrobia bacterium]|jgi:large subunit ribosomal protein L10|nr:50S ribosomal protein L10 [Verrucomicrobiota bacterium]
MRPEKESIVREAKAALDASEFAFLADYRGMTVTQLAEIRQALAEQSSEMHVLKNSFIGLAMGEERREALANDLQGPTGMITGAGDPTAVAKVLTKYAKSTGLPVLKGGVLNEMTLSASDVEAMAKIPPREVLLSILVGTVQAPMTSLVGVMNAKVTSLLYVLNAIKEKKNSAA